MLIALALAASVLGQTPSLEVAASVSSAQNMTVDELAIREGAAAWADAFTRGDVDLVDALLADDFVGTAKDGSPYDKPTLLGWVRAGPNLSASETTVDRIRFFGDIAIATGSDAMVGPAPEMRRIKSVWTDIWIRRDGRWFVIAAHDMAGTPD
ncbi:MAG: nuclear transport factor 2 family protein [Alphaproteobacteria bacterium]|nr:nuclear transport factor 2 family protein [Alphaproteobacteria bacterium]MBU2377780.1 nuclear transport factor 2 family protein [Alphaproteobacteria bacterium]